jgi:hypothetical protein
MADIDTAFQLAYGTAEFRSALIDGDTPWKVTVENVTPHILVSATSLSTAKSETVGWLIAQGYLQVGRWVDDAGGLGSRSVWVLSTV